MDAAGEEPFNFKAGSLSPEVKWLLPRPPLVLVTIHASEGVLTIRSCQVTGWARLLSLLHPHYPNLWPPATPSLAS